MGDNNNSSEAAQGFAQGSVGNVTSVGASVREQFETALAEALTMEPPAWGDVEKACSEFELDCAADPPLDTNPGSAHNIPAYDIHMSALLVLGDLDNARFLWKRIPAARKAAATPGGPELTALFEIVKAMWNRDFAGVFRAAAAFQWTDEIRPKVDAILGKIPPCRGARVSTPCVVCFCLGRKRRGCVWPEGGLFLVDFCSLTPNKQSPSGNERSSCSRAPLQTFQWETRA
jgi:CSN8/PSMD8/EIF3K family